MQSYRALHRRIPPPFGVYESLPGIDRGDGIGHPDNGLEAIRCVGESDAYKT